MSGLRKKLCIKGIGMKNNEVLTEKDIKNGMVLNCTYYLVYGNVEIDFERNLTVIKN
jgi:hypothetical protein